jgi:hypothetical protein
MAKRPHGNSRDSKLSHHLYEIRDKKNKGVYKYGISGDPLNEDGSSPRAEEQVSLFNTIVAWARFFARVLLRDIPGRNLARKMEDQYIEDYRKQHGHYPRGNRDRKP